MSHPSIRAFFDPNTWNITYVVWDAATKDAVVIDPVMDFDPLTVKTSDTHISGVAEFIKSEGLTVHFSLETHAHADHMSGAQLLKGFFPKVQVGIGKDVVAVQEVFKGALNLDIATDGSQFDVLIGDGDTLKAGSLEFTAIHTPGHTPACTSYKFGGTVFVGDAIFMPDFGTGRCDFPSGSADNLYSSIQKLYALPDDTRLYVGHDYQPGGRELKYMTTVGESKVNNIQIKAGTSREEFVTWRSERDATLRPPKLIFQSIQVNVTAGHLPEPEANGAAYLKLPLS